MFCVIRNATARLIKIVIPDFIVFYKAPCFPKSDIFFDKSNLNMAQRSITSFFKKTPKKDEDIIEDVKENVGKGNEEIPKVNGKSSLGKRQRIESSSSDNSQSPKKLTASEKKKTVKRQRIESSESEKESTEEVVIKIEKSSPVQDKKKIKQDNVKETKKVSPLRENKKIKNEKVETEPKAKIQSEKVDTGPEAKIKNGSPEDSKSKKSNSKKKDNKGNEEDELKPNVSEVDYNPAKDKYHPIKDACWAHGDKVPYLALAKTLEAIEATSSRLKMIEILSNYLRSVIVLTPEDLLPSVYMCLNQLAPAYHSLELGIAETYLMKAIGACTGRSLAHMKTALSSCGDLGQVAQTAREAQRMLLKLPPLALRNVFATLKEIAHMSGQASVNKKISKIQGLYVATRHSEAKYLIRTLQGKLRVGLAEQSVLQALSTATATTPPQAWPPRTLDMSRTMNPDAFKARVEEHAVIIKTTYCECPNYDLIIPTLLEHGVASLPQHCRLTPGIPLKPMLAYPTRGVAEVFQRFENIELTCEYKYDGERAQIHIPGTESPEFSNAKVFSRNQEDNTTKYPDMITRLPTLLKEGVQNCVLDTEAVAYDVVNKQILPFQVLSTRKRKDATEEDIKVQVCVFVFDLLYLNGAPLVREPLAKRRQLLRKHFNEVPGEWQLATSKDCDSLESVQEFLEEAVKASCEGLMVKTLAGADATYEIARRSHNWLKLKKDYLDGCGDTIDVVVIGAYHGRGRRAGHYGGFLLACYHPQLEEYQSLCKIGTGFSDTQLKTLTEELQKHVIVAPRGYYRYDSSHAPDVWVSPQCVWEVRCADLSLSPAHRAAIGLLAPDKGVSLRFPRFLRVREDKNPEQATSAQQIADMYMSQDQVKNQVSKPDIQHDDFY